MTRNSAVLLVGGAALAGLLGGCRVEKSTHGDGKDVNISTPFGGMHVRTNGADAMTGIGLPSYPGAEAAYDDGNDNRSANVDMSFGAFQLRVKKADFRTDDAQDKVEAFYRDGMKRFGDVIACRNGHAVGSPERTVEGLTCDNEGNHHISVDDHAGNNKLELKAGSKTHLHIVEIEPDGSGTKFGLVALDLPGKVTADERDGKGTE
ncbi:MAG TPA: hypothetical protein VGN01_08320 [Acidobacteriaceae bacterium]|jgi:hypothetical protein